VARVNVILKRYHAPATKIVDSPSLLSHGALELDTEKHIASWKKQPLQLTSTEFSLLKTLLSSPEKVYERDQLMTLAYGGNIHVSDRTIDSHIRHLRDKLQQAGGIEAIQTVRGVGYKLGPCA
jgi:two-component system OmpR family response regulator